MHNQTDRDSKKTVGCLFQPWENKWGLRGDPFLWEEMTLYLSKEPLPASVSQLMALIEKSFAQLVGSSLTETSPSVYVERFDHGGLSGGHICYEFWKDEVLPELHRRYLALKYVDSMRSPRMIDKPCRYESYPGGCRFGATCRFHHSKPIAHTTKPIISHGHFGHAHHQTSNKRLSPPLNGMIHNTLSTSSDSGHFLTNQESSQSVSVSPKSVFEMMESANVHDLNMDFLTKPASAASLQLPLSLNNQNNNISMQPHNNTLNMMMASFAPDFDSAVFGHNYPPFYPQTSFGPTTHGYSFLG